MTEYEEMTDRKYKYQTFQKLNKENTCLKIIKSAWFYFEESLLIWGTYKPIKRLHDTQIFSYWSRTRGKIQISFSSLFENSE